MKGQDPGRPVHPDLLLSSQAVLHAFDSTNGVLPDVLRIETNVLHDRALTCIYGKHKHSDRKCS